MDQYPEFCFADRQGSVSVYWDGPEDPKNTVLLRGSAFDRWFDLL